MGLSKNIIFLMRSSDLLSSLNSAISWGFPSSYHQLGIENPCEVADHEQQRSFDANATFSRIITKQNTTTVDDGSVSCFDFEEGQAGSTR